MNDSIMLHQIMGTYVVHYRCNLSQHHTAGGSENVCVRRLQI